MLYPVRPVVLEVDSGPSGPVNDRILEFRTSGGFSGGKKSKEIEEIFFGFFRFFFLDFFSISYVQYQASIIAMTFNNCYHSYHVWIEKVYYHQLVFLLLPTEQYFREQLI